MKIRTWLTVNSRGSVRTTKKRPALELDEISIALNLELPDALFTRPQLSADIKIPDEAAATEIISTEVVEDVREAVKQATGMELNITVVDEI